MNAGRTSTHSHNDYNVPSLAATPSTGYVRLRDEEMNTTSPSPLNVEEAIAAQDAGLNTEAHQKYAKYYALVGATLILFWGDDEILLVWSMAVGATCIVLLLILREQPNATVRRDGSSLLAEVREGYNNIPMRYRLHMEYGWPPVALYLAVLFSSFNNNLPVAYKITVIYQCTLIFLFWATIMGQSILVAWVLNDRLDLSEWDDNDDESLNSPRGEEGASLLQKAQNSESAKTPESFRLGMACLFFAGVIMTIVSYRHFNKLNRFISSTESFGTIVKSFNFVLPWSLVHVVTW
eukprot:CAMPEP_0183712822 /NCGR_PEP_ID=MMETSP0737-20130205/7878_1 /TAXON_ID=385413 /ORGANISM="Thalassiosira miniscula, Strain CCMP1093" /LENGTH=292 /DNA_ID=CAMNT_0025941535 /DNA_START=300 /DNA_END=1175 /DNA_ORIENTATION=+